MEFVMYHCFIHKVSHIIILFHTLVYSFTHYYIVSYIIILLYTLLYCFVHGITLYVRCRNVR